MSRNFMMAQLTESAGTNRSTRLSGSYHAADGAHVSTPPGATTVEYHRPMRIVCAAAVFALLSPASAAAQMCTGRASFDSMSLQLRGAGAFSASQRQAALAVAHGTDRLFTQAAGHFDSRSPLGRYALTAGIGTDQPLTPDNRWHVCPIVEVVYGWRPSAGRDAASVELSARGSIGLLALNSASAAVIPTLTLGLRRAYPVSRAAAGSGGNALSIGGGLGIVLRRGIAFRPGFVLLLGARPRGWGATAELSLNVFRS
jgi:hypothetical protein